MVTTREIEYEADGGTVMVGHLALPEAEGRRPAVLVAHEAPGLDDVHRQRADRLAELGYVAFALDGHGGGQWVNDAQRRERVAAIMGDPDRARALGGAGLDVLLAQDQVDPDRVAAIGYCFGGLIVLELARDGADLKAVVGFHPGLQSSRPEDARDITGKVLVCVGADDPYVDLERRSAFEAEMRAGGVDWRMHVYGGIQHSFTHPRADQAGIPGLAYDRPTAERAWRAMLDLFDETLT
ncbi:MAG TPA: dienelactone hydrolase family protein [Acidimicrobiales bacterium]|nr:dienelactone hydrolase family protein [Acidimicrobiales bacterium]